MYIIYRRPFYRHKKFVRVPVHVLAFAIIVIQNVCGFEGEDFGYTNHNANIRTKKIATRRLSVIRVLFIFTLIKKIILMRKGFQVLLLFFAVLLFAQNSQRKFQKIDFKNNLTEITVNDGVYQLKFFSPEMVETAFIPSGQTLTTVSHAVVAEPETVKQKISDKGNFIMLETSGLTVKIQKTPFQISYFKGKELLISEKNGYGKYENGEINGHAQNFETLSFNLSPKEILYGGGARALGMNRRGNRLMLYNRAQYGYETRSELMNFTMPIVVSSKNYLLHFDNAPIGYLDLDSKKDNSLTYETISGRKVYQVISGKTWEATVKNYTALTGRQPLLPRWSLGNFSSRFGYHSQKETLETIRKFRAEKIPVDAVILDLYWFGKTIQGTLGNLAFDKDNFPNPEQMIAELRKENTETILITEPFILKTSNRWHEAVDQDILGKDDKGNPFVFDFYFGTTGIIDLYSKKGNQWFKEIYRGLINKGVTGIWGDLGEPEMHPSTLLHATGTADEVHNIYGHDWAKLVKESFAETTPDARPFILMRAGYSGSQRYGMVPWSGDVNRSWGGLQSQPEIALQMGLQGMAYMHSDLGGFAGANLDDELYTRWLQYGVFQPIYRPHAQEEVPSEAVYRSEKVKALARKSIELRYALLPYNYHLAFENHKEGTPLMRPLFFEEPENQKLYLYSDAYLWGKDFLIAPVLKKEQKQQVVYFPKNSNWYNFYTDVKISGGSTQNITLEEDKIPTFVRGGAIIPMAKPMQSTKEYSGNVLVLHYYFDESITESETKLYNDDGLTREAFEKGQFEIMEFEAEHHGKTLTFELENETGKQFSAQTKKIELVMHHILTAPKSIKRDGKKMKFEYDEQKKILKILFDWDSKKESILKFRF